MTTAPARPNLVAMPLAGAVAVICTATALSGVVSGWAWLGYVIIATVVVATAGTVARVVRVPGEVIWAIQLVALVFLTVPLFSRSGALLFLPGPAAINDITSLLGQSIDEIRQDVPPVIADAPMLCLITLCTGVVAIAVDTLVATAGVPAT
ncbi:MAG TPA: transglutaminaseTgpA domain-containing protein, partial [Pseudonocardiaceae bacterium]